MRAPGTGQQSASGVTSPSVFPARPDTLHFPRNRRGVRAAPTWLANRRLNGYAQAGSIFKFPWCLVIRHSKPPLNSHCSRRLCPFSKKSILKLNRSSSRANPLSWRRIWKNFPTATSHSVIDSRARPTNRLGDNQYNAGAPVSTPRFYNRIARNMLGSVPSAPRHEPRTEFLALPP